MGSIELPVPRSIRPVTPPLGLYLRVGHNDHRVIKEAIDTGRTRFSGIVVEAHRVDRHTELMRSVSHRGLECILDPCTQASATPGGYSESLGSLPWGAGHQHRIADFAPTKLLALVTAMAMFAMEHNFSQIISPSHYVSGADDPWLEVDVAAARALRNQLDRSGAERIGLIYLLTLPYAVLRDEGELRAIVSRLQNVRIDGLWIRIDNFGENSTGLAVRHFLAASLELHRLGAPVVADQCGGIVGLGLLSTSAVGGLSHGVTSRERFSAGSWKKASDTKFSLGHRVYLPTLDLFLKPQEARRIFEASVGLRSHFACNDSRCCGRGLVDMVENPGMHFLTQRMGQVSALSQVPQSLRPKEFLERLVRPTADAAVRFSQAKSLDDALRERVIKQRKRLDLLRIQLEDLLSERRLPSTSVVPSTRSAREHGIGR